MSYHADLGLHQALGQPPGATQTKNGAAEKESSWGDKAFDVLSLILGGGRGGAGTQPQQETFMDKYGTYVLVGGGLVVAYLIATRKR